MVVVVEVVLKLGTIILKLGTVRKLLPMKQISLAKVCIIENKTKDSQTCVDIMNKMKKQSLTGGIERLTGDDYED